ncbi:MULTISPECIES: gamma carbonic anhydrase family protein [unclassified Francisella]|uniref:gamma carbonic anhydrase family protein n=1 Tax=unclassified Francisella TaxID=2610885 RepID=UPI002E3746A3|nr:MULTISPECIES: gamma carbonic anhydrase family protein [unclassified Francisella]MED7820308.1 gamma carbonic anhydrase family protein [Francisella sp. 19S2-4]MED7831147.1 gamma carbonic anhydrase family protein [Francisella sp. 19S2-10]
MILINDEKKIHPTVLMDDTAWVFGDVTMGPNCRVYAGAVIRADLDKMVFGEGVCINDNCILHGIGVTGEGFLIGDGTNITHGAMVHKSVIGKNCMIGIGAKVVDTVIGNNCLIAAGSVVIDRIPDFSFVAGVPGKVIKKVTEREWNIIRHSWLAQYEESFVVNNKAQKTKWIDEHKESGYANKIENVFPEFSRIQK